MRNQFLLLLLFVVLGTRANQALANPDSTVWVDPVSQYTFQYIGRFPFYKSSSQVGAEDACRHLGPRWQLVDYPMLNEGASFGNPLVVRMFSETEFSENFIYEYFTESAQVIWIKKLGPLSKCMTFYRSMSGQKIKLQADDYCRRVLPVVCVHRP